MALGTVKRRVLEVLASGPAGSPVIDAELADVNPKTLKQERTRLRNLGWVTRSPGGTWAITDAGMAALSDDDTGPPPADLDQWAAAPPALPRPAPPVPQIRHAVADFAPADDDGDQADADAEFAPPSWRDALGDEYTDPAAQCPGECPCGGAGTIRYTSCHTGTVCEECGPAECWAPSARAEEKAREYANVEKAAAIRAGKATARISQHEIDQRNRAVFRLRKNMTAWVNQRLGWDINGYTRADLEWFREVIADTSDMDRLRQLGADLLSMNIEVKQPGIFARLLNLRPLADDDEDQEPEDDEPGPEQIEAPRPRLAIEQRPRVVPGYVAPVADPALSFWADYDSSVRSSAAMDAVIAARARAAARSRERAHGN